MLEITIKSLSEIQEEDFEKFLEKSLEKEQEELIEKLKIEELKKQWLKAAEQFI